MPLYANVVVQLTGADPNLLAVSGRCQKVAREGGLDRKQIEAFVEEFVEKLTLRPEAKPVEGAVREIVGNGSPRSSVSPGTRERGELHRIP